jgi:hypothetical protein
MQYVKCNKIYDVQQIHTWVNHNSLKYVSSLYWKPWWTAIKISMQLHSYLSIKFIYSDASKYLHCNPSNHPNLWVTFFLSWKLLNMKHHSNIHHIHCGKRQSNIHYKWLHLTNSCVSQNHYEEPNEFTDLLLYVTWTWNTELIMLRGLLSWFQSMIQFAHLHNQRFCKRQTNSTVITIFVFPTLHVYMSTLANIHRISVLQ